MPMLEVFGPPRSWPGEDLVAFSDRFDADLALAAYRSGVFPMPLRRAFFPERMAWWSPLRRGVLAAGELKVSRSLRQSARRYRVTCDQAFDRVIAACAEPDRPGGWIDADIQAVYGRLHRMGRVHSVECWSADGRLAGGLYGVGLGGLFAGESMFHRSGYGRDASKVALWRLAEWLGRDGRPRLIDVQWSTPHLASLGVSEISRAAYLDRLAELIDWPDPPWADWARSGRS
ncbi:MAG: leucyl/phenylalanyl-tRNA--protein transferase [Propionibacteriaceae bacterium]|nr:leucyl/phenylalanyl-tRNA--protein transferase [Propionibacteriaceae bacterium]